MDLAMRRGLLTPEAAATVLRFVPRDPPVRVDPAAHVARQAEIIPLAKCMGRAVARGALPLRTASFVLQAKHPDCPPGISRATSALLDEARQHSLNRSLAEQRVRRTAWPLCEARKPGLEVLAAVARVGDPLCSWEQLAICREIANQILRRRPHGCR